MKKLILSSLFALACIFSAYAQKELYKVIEAHVGTLDITYQPVWSAKKLKANTIEVDQQERTFKVFLKKGRVDEYRIVGESGSASYAYVQAREDMIQQGWEVTDYLVTDEWGHSALLRKRIHPKAGKTQFYIYGNGVYGYDVEPAKQ